jgi:hypothetical protein
MAQTQQDLVANSQTRILALGDATPDREFGAFGQFATSVNKSVTGQ